MKLYLQRKAGFQAGIDGKGDRSLRGGHSYTVALTVSGQIDDTTGMVVNIRDIDALLRRHALRDLDSAILDRDLPEFCHTTPTDENLAALIWNRIKGKLPEGTRLEEIALTSSSNITAKISDSSRTLEKPMLTLTRTYEFSAAHRLHVASLSQKQNLDYFGKCNWENGHGHNYELEVTLSGKTDPVTGELAGGDIDAIVEREILSRYDHRNLNYDVDELANLNPTSENVTRVIWDRLRSPIDTALGGRAKLYRVALRETARNYFEYYGE